MLALRFPLLLGICLLWAMPGRGQQASEPLRPTILLKASPFTLIDPVVSCAVVGAEYQWPTNWSLSGYVGIPTPYLGDQPNTLRQQKRYAKFRVEGRRYFPRTARRATFLAAELFYVPLRYNAAADTYQRDTTHYHGENLQVRHNALGISLNWGIAWQLGQRWQLETATGLGVRRVTHTVRAEREQPIYQPFTEWIAPARVGTSYKPHMALHFTVGYALHPRN